VNKVQTIKEMSLYSYLVEEIKKDPYLEEFMGTSLEEFHKLLKYKLEEKSPSYDIFQLFRGNPN
jgi:hypothetical protein